VQRVSNLPNPMNRRNPPNVFTVPTSAPARRRGRQDDAPIDRRGPERLARVEKAFDERRAAGGGRRRDDLVARVCSGEGSGDAGERRGHVGLVSRIEAVEHDGHRHGRGGGLDVDDRLPHRAVAHGEVLGAQAHDRAPFGIHDGDVGLPLGRLGRTHGNERRGGREDSQPGGPPEVPTAMNWA
jgi:hypothetical protein